MYTYVEQNHNEKYQENRLEENNTFLTVVIFGWLYYG
jgi:hypothetical protein